MKQKFSSLAVEMQQVRGELARSPRRRRVRTRSPDCTTGSPFRRSWTTWHRRQGRIPAPACCWSISISSNASTTPTVLRVITCCTRVARQIRASVRGRDLVARYGGEEFAVLLRDTPRSGCQAVAENVRQQVGCARIDLPAELGFEQKLAVTVSVGGAWYRDQESPQTLVDQSRPRAVPVKRERSQQGDLGSRQTGS